jgi:tRNA (guanine-N7-)-methyltransferase
VNDTNLTPPDTSAEAPNGDAPPKFLKTIKSFVRRAGRITTGQSKAFEDLGDKYLLNYDASKNAIDLIATQATNTPATGENQVVNPVVFEIGFGMGEATEHIAKLLPKTLFLACEVHQPRCVGGSVITDDFVVRLAGFALNRVDFLQRAVDPIGSNRFVDQLPFL